MTAAAFFNGWSGPLRVLVLGTLSYVALVLVLRVSGKRALSKMNAFDLIVTVALGSALATMTLSKSVALIEGVTAIVLLVTLQYVVTWLSVRSERIQSLVKARPALLMHHGTFMRNVMLAERISQEEVLSAIRSSGLRHAEDCTVILETDGSLSVIAVGESSGAPSSLSNVMPPHRSQGKDG